MKGKKSEFSEIFFDFLKQKAYSKISVNEICDQRKCSRQSFYYYFASTDDCFRDALRQSFEKSIRNEFLITDLFDYMDNNRDVIDNCLLEKTSMILFQQVLISYCEENLEYICSRNVPDFLSLKPLTKQVFIGFYVAGILRVAEMYYNTENKTFRGKYIAACHTILGTSMDVTETVNRLLRDEQ